MRSSGEKSCSVGSAKRKTGSLKQARKQSREKSGPPAADVNPCKALNNLQKYENKSVAATGQGMLFPETAILNIEPGNGNIDSGIRSAIPLHARSATRCNLAITYLIEIKNEKSRPRIGQALAQWTGAGIRRPRALRGDKSCMVIQNAGRRKTVEPKTHMKAPAAIWSFNALMPNGFDAAT